MFSVRVISFAAFCFVMASQGLAQEIELSTLENEYDSCTQFALRAVMQDAERRAANRDNDWRGEYICSKTGLRNDCKIEKVEQFIAADEMKTYSVIVTVFLGSTVRNRPRKQTFAAFGIDMKDENDNCWISKPRLANVNY